MATAVARRACALLNVPAHGTTAICRHLDWVSLANVARSCKHLFHAVIKYRASRRGAIRRLSPALTTFADALRIIRSGDAVAFNGCIRSMVLGHRVATSGAQFHMWCLDVQTFSELDTIFVNDGYARDTTHMKDFAVCNCRFMTYRKVFPFCCVTVATTPESNVTAASQMLRHCASPAAMIYWNGFKTVILFPEMIQSARGWGNDANAWGDGECFPWIREPLKLRERGMYCYRDLLVRVTKARNDFRTNDNSIWYTIILPL